jgi:hypothetical protein
MAEKITLVDMIPYSLSGETSDDGEPSLAVDPANVSNIAAHAFTPDPMKSKFAPFYYSLDGGANWTLNAALPGGETAADLTLKFARLSSVLYVAMLRSDTSDLNILRSENLTTQNFDLLVQRPGDDQPWVEATTVPDPDAKSVFGVDRVYVGSNDFSPPLDPGKTAALDFSLDARFGPPPANFQRARLEVRTTGGQDGYSIRPAIHHPSGVVYAAYVAWRKEDPVVADIVVCRDDNWGSGGQPFTALTDNNDGKPGVRVVTGVPLPPLSSGFLGTQRIGGTGDLAIAIDPTGPGGQTVYLAWTDGATPGEYTLHLRRSQDGGKTWSSDLRTIQQALNPGLAVNSKGVVGLLYQQLWSYYQNFWRTVFERSDDGFQTVNKLQLALTRDQTGSFFIPILNFGPTIGDYANLVAVKENFYGVFSAYNEPSTGYFLNGPPYLRNYDPKNQVLLDTNFKPVAPSIDPFFFKVEQPEPPSQGGGGNFGFPWPWWGGRKGPVIKTVKPMKAKGDDGH